ncbi:MAG: AtpZ/AtpI family protein, partial [Sediminibacterium sp.]|nr:AtpZ/AtpI family protein [Sediminibacterium sp.]
MENNSPLNQESKKAGPSQQGTGFAFMRYSGMAFQLMVIIGVFTYAGKWVDTYFENKFPLFLVIGALTGT